MPRRVWAAGALPHELGVDWLASPGTNAAPRAARVFCLPAPKCRCQLVFSGRQQEDRRSGTEDVAGLAVWRRRSWFSRLANRATRAVFAQTFLAIQQALLQVRWPARAPRLANTPILLVLGWLAAFGDALDLAGLVVSPGWPVWRHNKPSHVLQALGLSPEPIAGALRVLLALLPRPMISSSSRRLAIPTA